MADAEMMRTEFVGHPQISVEALGWDPPEEYRVTYRLNGVQPDPSTGQPVIADVHQIHIKLPAEYPRSKPYCTTQTAVFHPNFGQRAGDEICIGDYWTPAQTLVDIVVKIGEMLQFQAYNVKSPLNAVAARWVAENEGVFPVGDVELFQAEPDIALTGEVDGAEVAEALARADNDADARADGADEAATPDSDADGDSSGDDSIVEDDSESDDAAASEPGAEASANSPLTITLD